VNEFTKGFYDNINDFFEAIEEAVIEPLEGEYELDVSGNG